MVVLGEMDILVVGKVVVLGQKLGRFQKIPLVTLVKTRVQRMQTPSFAD